MAHLVTEISRQSHHDKGKICSTRSKYREGKKDTAVKVYTINQESCFLIIQGVASVGAGKELKALCDQYGFVDSIQPIDDYPSEEFTETYLVKYANFFAARTAKKHLDDRAFFGGILHVCYAPEFETVEDTRKKLIERRKFIAAKTRSFLQDEGNVSTDFKAHQKRKDYVGKVSDDSNHLKKTKLDSQYMTYIWAGKEYSVPTVSSADSQEKNLEHKAELAVRYEQYSQKHTAELGAQLSNEPLNFTRQPDINNQTSEFVSKIVPQANSQQFVPRQLSHLKGQNLATVKTSEESKVQNNSVVQESEILDIKTSNHSYDNTMDEIRKKLSSFAGANLAVNLKGKR